MVAGPFIVLPGRQVQRVQLKGRLAALQGLGNHVQDSGPRIDHAGAEDADFRRDVREGTQVADQHGRRNRRAQIDLPKYHRRSRRVRVECIDAIVFGGDEEHIARSTFGNRKATDVERLGEDLAIHREYTQFSEAPGRDVGNYQFCFL